MATVVTANVNGIRAALKRGGVSWLEQAGIDVLCLQEVRASDEQLAESLVGSAFQTWSIAHAPSVDKGRSGVAILTPNPHSEVRIGVGPDEFAATGRWIEVDVEIAGDLVTVVSAYAPTGEATDEVRQAEKYRYLDAMQARLETLAARSKRGAGEALVCGDFNVAHRENDIKNWKGNRGRAGFLEQERDYLDHWFGALGWTDLGRHLAGDGPGPYTWWSWRGRGFDTDGGWRIDYVLSTPGLTARANSALVGKANTYAERWSDHAPLIINFN
jgi:exodeoxyribonuclease-3